MSNVTCFWLPTDARRRPELWPGNSTQNLCGSYGVLTVVPAGVTCPDCLAKMGRTPPIRRPPVNSPDSTTPADPVQHPTHYTKGEVECIDAIEAATSGLTGMEGYCTGNALKYVWRWKHKGGVEDLKKAKWYIERLISELESA